jgi:hypothetical protein
MQGNPLVKIHGALQDKGIDLDAPCRHVSPLGLDVDPLLPDEITRDNRTCHSSIQTSSSNWSLNSITNGGHEIQRTVPIRGWQVPPTPSPIAGELPVDSAIQEALTIFAELHSVENSPMIQEEAGPGISMEHLLRILTSPDKIELFKNTTGPAVFKFLDAVQHVSVVLYCHPSNTFHRNFVIRLVIWILVVM